MASTSSIVLFVIGLLLIGAEVFVPGGLLGVIGAGVMAGAVAALFFPNHYWLVFWVTFALVAAVSWVFLMELYRRVRRAPRKEVMSSANLVNSEGTVVETVKPGAMSGKVRIGGDVWSAQAEDELPPGTRVVVVDTEGVRVIVRKAEQ